MAVADRLVVDEIDDAPGQDQSGASSHGQSLPSSASKRASENRVSH